MRLAEVVGFNPESAHLILCLLCQDLSIQGSQRTWSWFPLLPTVTNLFLEIILSLLCKSVVF